MLHETANSAPITIRKLMPHFAAEVGGVNAGEPLDAPTLAALRAAMNDYAVVVLRGQDIDDGQQLRFSAQFGELEPVYELKMESASENRNVVILSNVDKATGKVYSADDPRGAYREGNELWHSDSSFKPIPAKYSILSGREVPPEGADTEFADLRIVWDELSAAHKARYETLSAEHSIVYSRSVSNPGQTFFSDEEKELLKPVHHPLVRRHPENGRVAVYAGAHASHILGLPIEQGRAIIDDLIERATRPERVYRHHWQAKDIVIWDNRSVLHRGTKFDAGRYARVMHRTTIAGDAT